MVLISGEDEIYVSNLSSWAIIHDHVIFISSNSAGSVSTNIDLTMTSTIALLIQSKSVNLTRMSVKLLILLLTNIKQLLIELKKKSS